MILDTVVVGALQVNCYILGCERTRQAVVIDPGDEAEAIQTALHRRGLSLAGMIVTHAHFDHVLAARALQEATGTPFYLPGAERPLLALMRRMTLAWLAFDPGEPPRIDGELTPGQPVRFGLETLEVRLTPGHSPGGATFVHHGSRRAFTGDALFAGSIGRTDLPGGDIDILLSSIRTAILALPDDYAVLSGHGPASTVGAERRGNPYLANYE
jgi:glyoxylase-like metal-dependent hydrolase (beta-lactamase superfamily II)